LVADPKNPAKQRFQAIAEEGDTLHDLFGNLFGSYWRLDGRVAGVGLAEQWEQVEPGTAVDLPDLVSGPVVKGALRDDGNYYRFIPDYGFVIIDNPETQVMKLVVFEGALEMAGLGPLAWANRGRRTVSALRVASKTRKLDKFWWASLGLFKDSKQAAKALGALNRGVGRVARPTVSDPSLRKTVTALYKGIPNTPAGRQLGLGSTADAARVELATGIKVFGRDHVQKAREGVNRLVKWLKKQSPRAIKSGGTAASAADRKVAERLLRDLRNAIDGR